MSGRIRCEGVRRAAGIFVLTALVSPPLAASPHRSSSQGPAHRNDDTVERVQSRWREGPVRYIITTEEDREFKQLATDEDRARFIESFWARRDPDPRTLLNEFRYEFWTRVATANRFFSESAKPGWKTDMGRYYVLLGPPDDRDTSGEMPLGLGRRGVRGAIVWTYSHAPNPKIGTGLKIVFTRDASGEYRAETDPSIAQEVIRNQTWTPNPDLTAFGISLLQMAPRLTDLQLMMDLGRLEEIPSEEQLLTTVVTAEEFFGVLPFSARYDFFAGARGASIAALTLSLHPDPLDPGRRPGPPDY
ncbi:MAG TPA: GWxTD domain-containing protein, partial [Candidatus Polarisedimenticolia bacterium]|nr:GWxTD domain-containing protein [Candidatus Polarisedimenticolia bacterium]